MTLVVAQVSDAARREEPILSVRDLSASYGAVAALRDVSFELNAGEIVGLAGDNGAGKSTLLRCISGDLAEMTGDVWLRANRVEPGSLSHSAGHIGVVWQHAVLPENLDVAAALMLGKERRRILMSGPRAHARTRAMLDDLGLPITASSRLVSALNAAERQLLAIARAFIPQPDLLLLDEPTAGLNQIDSARVEHLVRRFRDRGTTTLLVSHDVDQLFRMTDRIVVLRYGRVVAELEPARSHPDELLALMAGHEVSAVARRQLGRLHELATQLSTPARADAAGTAAELTLILSTLGLALGTSALSLHLLDGATLRQVSAIGLPEILQRAWTSVPLFGTGNPLAAAAAENTPMVDDGGEPSAHRSLLQAAGFTTWWAAPFSSAGGARGVIGVYRTQPGAPARDELDLINLYAGYAAAALEREHLLAELTGRNRVLEAVRTVLQTLAGPAGLDDGISTVLQTLRDAVAAEAVGLFERAEGEELACRAFAGTAEIDADHLADGVPGALDDGSRDARAQVSALANGGSRLVVKLSETTVLAAQWREHFADPDERILLEDAAHSILLALERERTEVAHREVAALLRSQELQRAFLARLSHELRTPLTAIHGYASSLLQPDVDWDDATRVRFLGRISGESARLGRLVGDLLDFSMIESGMLRLRPDWVDLALVVDAARACLPPQLAAAVAVSREADLPVIWADHDRIEQMLVNLLDNAVRHNPTGTSVSIRLACDGPSDVVIEIADDGAGIPESTSADGAPARPSETAGAGLGLLITQGIVDAHHGSMLREPAHPGTRYLIHLPVEPSAPAMELDDA